MNEERLRYKILHGMKLKVLFLNDIGFQHGAGIAGLRQVQSLLLSGHDVQGLCWMQGAPESMLPVVPIGARGSWLGMFQRPLLHARNGCDNARIVKAILADIRAIQPDVVVVGNIHASGWPLELLPAIRAYGPLVIAYMHDCFYITGRCAHPFECPRFKTGCDETCASWRLYPSLEKEKIAAAWKLRRDIFCGPGRVCLAANSRWTLGMVKAALDNPYHADVLYLGLDHHLFRPMKRALARRILGLPEEGLVILSGAVNVNDPHKGGHILKEIMAKLSGKAMFLIFGAEGAGGEGVVTTGLIRDFRKMPLLYSAADLFIGTSLAESFGQTYLEAAACGIPTVAFRIGGIPEVARHGINARLVDEVKTKDFLNEVEFFIENPPVRKAYGEAGRAIVAEEFTLEKQAERWADYLMKASALPDSGVAGSQGQG